MKRTGVIVAFRDVKADEVKPIHEHLKSIFPNVTIAVVGGATNGFAFEYDDGTTATDGEAAS